MRSSTHDQPRYYGNVFNLEHGLMSAGVIVLAVIVLILVGAESRAVQGGQVIPFDAPMTAPSNDGELEGWVRPAEIRVHAPTVGVPVLDERLLRRFRLLEPPAPPPVREATAAGYEPVAPLGADRSPDAPPDR
ncbi:MAG: hypothetical protein P8Y10_03665 [Gemmatimonadales bacterium]|jgi:hypothetical protein